MVGRVGANAAAGSELSSNNESEVSLMLPEVSRQISVSLRKIICVAAKRRIIAT